jgi:hypothetical protein
MRFRLLLIVIGALLVAATFTFPTWYPLLPQGGGPTVQFAGLPPELDAAFGVLPEDIQQAYLTLADTEPEQALAMLTARLRGGDPAPASDQELPQLVGSVIAARGSFAGVDSLRVVEGDVTIYQAADGAWLIRFENFQITPGPALQVALVAMASPQTLEDLRMGDLDFALGALRGISGNQNYNAPAEMDLAQYRSVAIYSETLELVYASANLFISNF